MESEQGHKLFLFPTKGTSNASYNHPEDIVALYLNEAGKNKLGYVVWP